PVADFQDRDIEGAAAKVEHRDFLVLFLVESVRQRSGGRLVDNAEDVEPGNPASILGRLPLTVIEVRRHSDDRLGDFFTEIVLGSLFHLLKDKGGNLGRAVLLAAYLYPGGTVTVTHDLVRQDFDRLLDFAVLIATAHQALYRKHRVGRIRNRLAARDLTHQPFI